MGKSLIPRINLIYAIPVAVMTLPWLGLIAIHFDVNSYSFILEGAPYTSQPLLLYNFFLLTFVLTLLMLPRLHASLATRSKLRRLGVPKAGRAGLSLVLASTAAFISFSYSVNPLDILLGTLGKSDVRQSGPLTAVFAKYLLPVLLAYACLVYQAGRIRLRTLVYIGVLTFIAGLSLGGKTSAIIVMLPGLIAIFLNGMGWRAAIVLGLMACVGTIFAGLLFDRHLQGGSVENAARYVVHRAFILPAEVPYKMTRRTIDGNEFDYAPTLAAAATDSVLLRYVGHDELYRFNLARAISATLYPHLVERVNSGRWNHTPTVFSEGVLAMGPSFYWVFAILVASLIWTMNRIIRRLVAKRALPAAAVVLGYFVFVLIAWINSGGLATLVHPLPLLSYACAWILLHTIDRRPLVLASRSTAHSLAC